METIQTILTRRSIRSYQPGPVPEDMIRQLLEAAMFAPSARNTRSWSFVVVENRENLDRIMAVHPYAGMMKTAPLCIAVCGDREREPHDGYLAVNCSAAVQNLLLAAHDLGLGTCWLGVYPREERMAALSPVLGLPDTVIPIALVAVGWPNEVKPTPPRFEPERIYRETYGNQTESDR